MSISSFFPTRHVKILTDSDFLLDNEDKITLKHKELSVILFHDESNISTRILAIWDNISKNVSGTIFCVCDMTKQTGISTKFEELVFDRSSPYNRLASHKKPFILVYRNGMPKKDYKDTFSETKLTIFTANLIDNNSDETDKDISLHQDIDDDSD